MDELLNEREAAKVLGVAACTLLRWRLNGIGPRCVRLGKKAVRYRPVDLIAYTEQRIEGGVVEVHNE